MNDDRNRSPVKTGIGITAAMVIGALAAGYFERRHDVGESVQHAVGHEARREQSDGSELQQLQRRVDSLERSTAGLQTSSSQPSAASQPSARELDAGRPVRRPTEADEIERAQAQLTLFDSFLEGESVDARWQADTRRLAERVLTAKGMDGVVLETIRCGSTLCRMDLSISGEMETASADLLEGLARAAPHGGIWMNTSLPGKGRAVAFIGRQGSSLPVAVP